MTRTAAKSACLRIQLSLPWSPLAPSRSSPVPVEGNACAASPHNLQTGRGVATRLQATPNMPTSRYGKMTPKCPVMYTLSLARLCPLPGHLPCQLRATHPQQALTPGKPARVWPKSPRNLSGRCPPLPKAPSGPFKKTWAPRLAPWGPGGPSPLSQASNAPERVRPARILGLKGRARLKNPDRKEFFGLKAEKLKISLSEWGLSESLGDMSSYHGMGHAKHSAARVVRAVWWAWGGVGGGAGAVFVCV